MKLSSQEIQTLVINYRKAKGKQKEWLFTDLYNATTRIFEHLLRNENLDQAEKTSIKHDALCEAVNKWDKNKSSFVDWLYRLAIYDISDSRKKRANQKKVINFDPDFDLTLVPPDKVQNEEEFNVLWIKVTEIIRAKSQREAFLEVVIKGLSCAEAAIKLNRTKQNIENSLYHARRKLRKELVVEEATNRL